MNVDPSVLTSLRNAKTLPTGWLRALAAVVLMSPAAVCAQSPGPVPAGPDQILKLRAGQHYAGTRVLPRHDVMLKLRPKTATFDVTYNGFTPSAQAAFQHAVDIWEQLITSPVPIRVQANWIALEPGLLGSAGAPFYWSIGDLLYPDALADAIEGADNLPGVFDIVANFNSNFNWYLGTDANPSASQYDLVTVVLHELAHGLGFSGLMDVSEIGIGSWIFDLATGYAAFTEDLAGTSIVDTNVYPNPSTQLAGVLQSGDVFFAGPLAVAANGGVRPELYAPVTWQGGSSFSHLDETTYPPGNPNSLMTPFLNFAEAIHSPGDIVLCMFEDLGWTTSGACGASGDPGLSDLAELIVPGFEVDVADPLGPTTFFAVRNSSDTAVSVDVAYHGEQVAGTPLRTDVLNLGPQQTATVNVRNDLTDLNVAGSFATGLILITESGPSTGSLEGDFFRLDQANAFATGDRLVDPEEDFCLLQEIRFVEFGSGSQLRILLDDPQGASQPSFTYTAYDEAGNMLIEDDYFTSDHLTSIDVGDLGFNNSFGTVMFDFSGSGGGWASAKYSAFGLFSVELNSACRDQ